MVFFISCKHLVQEDCQVNDCNGCAFKSFDPAALRTALQKRHGVGAGVVDDIVASAQAGQFQVSSRVSSHDTKMAG